MPSPPLSRRLLAECLGSALLAAVVIGSGIAAQRLSSDSGLQLLENAAATAGLVLVIFALARSRRPATAPAAVRRVHRRSCSRSSPAAWPRSASSAPSIPTSRPPMPPR